MIQADGFDNKSTQEELQGTVRVGSLHHPQLEELPENELVELEGR